jgi:hypothetical protein
LITFLIQRNEFIILTGPKIRAMASQAGLHGKGTRVVKRQKTGERGRCKSLLLFEAAQGKASRAGRMVHGWLVSIILAVFELCSFYLPDTWLWDDEN